MAIVKHRSCLTEKASMHIPFFRLFTGIHLCAMTPDPVPSNTHSLKKARSAKAIWNVNASSQIGLMALRGIALVFHLAQSEGMPTTSTSTYGLAVGLLGHKNWPDTTYEDEKDTFYKL